MRFFLSIIVLLFINTTAKSSEESPAEVESKNKSWVEVEARLSTLEAKIHSKENNIEKLILEKNKMKESDPRLKEVIAEIVKEDKERHQAAIDMEKQRTILNYRFPERGAKASRKYQKIELKSVEEMEGHLGVDVRLDRTVNKMKSQYGAEKKNSGPTKKSAHPESSIDGEGAIILQK